MQTQPTSNSEKRDENLETKSRKAESGIHSDISYLNNRFDSRSLGEIEQLLERADLRFDQNQVDYAVDDLISAAGRLKDSNERVHRAYDIAIAKLSAIEGEAAPLNPRALALIKARRSLPT